MDKLEVLKAVRFGERIAEDELNDLERYFVATDQWNRVYNGEADIVYGSKGAGKSAIYALVDQRQDQLFDRGVLVRSAENVRGNTVFSDLIADPPPSERAFVDLWKLYFLLLTANTIRDFDLQSEEAVSLVAALEQAGLLPAKGTLSQFFSASRKLIWSYIFPDVESVEHTVALDPASGMPIYTRKSNYNRSTPETGAIGLPIDDLISKANTALEKAGMTIWILFDRLDVAFNDNLELEKNALRAIFRMYNDFKGFGNISLKIFVRDDIWKRITEGGFAEASHITKTVSIDWEYDSLLNLFVLRLITNPVIETFLNVSRSKVVEDFDLQKEIVNRIFPDQVETGNNPTTFRWMINRIQDSSGKSAPRELIHLLETIRQLQVARLERGEDEPQEEQLFDRAVFKAALKTVSKVRYEQTFVAENPTLREFTEALRAQKAEQTIETLAILWKIGDEESLKVAERLVNAGFFERRDNKGIATYWVPFVYRDALDLVQGKA
ncbi:P-loop ATPase, Sll1717 family [Sulfitobacter pontiacus]|uniref:P-loop ATPase, Sll1717 family n=1 Tax=Sulfitobacter pontiacus TaxID=60137 RepID=UPI0030EE11A0